MKTILVPTDFSATALNAAHYAVEMAIATEAHIMLLNVVQYPLLSPEVAAAAGTFEIVLDTAKTDMLNFKTQLEKYAAGDVSISTEIITGDPVGEIKNIAEVKKPVAIVMGIQGAGAAARVLFGSTAFRAMHELLFPVYLIPAHTRYKDLTHIGLACDLTDATDTINIASIKQLVNDNRATLDILYVSKPGKMNAAEVLPESKDLLNDLKEVHPQFHYTAGEDMVQVIKDFIRDKQLSLLIVVPQRRNFFSNIFHKSASNHIAAHIDIPLLSLHK